MLSEEQVKQIKEQLMKQIENLPSQEQQLAAQQIQAMTPEQIEQLLQQQGQQKDRQTSQQQGQQQGQQCVFCQIIKGELQTYKIDENKSALAVLEINPLSKGHTLVISKNHDKLETQAFSLANKIEKKLKSKLKADEVKLETSSFMGHKIINVLPLYKDQKLEKKPVKKEELEKIQKKLMKKAKSAAKTKTTRGRKKKIKKVRKLEKAPVRIP